MLSRNFIESEKERKKERWNDREIVRRIEKCHSSILAVSGIN